MEEIKTDAEVINEENTIALEAPEPKLKPELTKSKNLFGTGINKNLFNKSSIILMSYIAVFFIIILIIASSSAHSKYNRLSSEYNNLKTDTSYWTALPADEQQKIINLTDLTSEITKLQNDKSALQKDISSLQSQKKQLQSDIIQISGSPRTYPAGYLTAGADFDEGRYKIYGGSSNFIVHSSDGDLKVNIILGNGSYYSVKEYIYTFSSGDEIQAESTFKMVPVK